jgi:beta-N-acetylhexosaminidase
MQRLAVTPLIVAGDFERGASMRLAGTTKFPHAMAYGAAGDPEATRFAGRFTARESRALGIHWVFAPVADVNNNPGNPIINIRSYGEDPIAVAAHVKAFIEGAHSERDARVLVTAKHFPGHGDTAVDSHMALGRIEADRARIEEVELVPFKAAITAGVDAVMSAHIAVPALDPREIPATVSTAVLSNLLRDELGFRGIAVTDAMDMKGLVEQFEPAEAAVRALDAGADVLLMPVRPEEAINGIMEAVGNGRLSGERIDTSATRLLAAKARVGLNKRRSVDLERLNDVLEHPDAAAHAQRVADAAVALVKNEDDLVPFKDLARACFFVLQEGRKSVPGRRLAEELNARIKTGYVAILNPDLTAAELESFGARAANCSVVAVMTFATASAYRGSVELTGAYPALMQQFMSAGVPIVLASLGNPYLVRAYSGVDAYLAAFSTAPPSEVAIVKVLLGEVPSRARLPVTIPGIAARGFGL